MIRAKGHFLDPLQVAAAIGKPEYQVVATADPVDDALTAPIGRYLEDLLVGGDVRITRHRTHVGGSQVVEGLSTR